MLMRRDQSNPSACGVFGVRWKEVNASTQVAELRFEAWCPLEELIQL